MRKRTLVAILGTIFLLSTLSACLFVAKPTPSPEPTASATATPAPPRPTFTPVPPTPTRSPTVTPSPLPSLTHTPSIPTLRVNADLLNVRETPSLDSKILARVKEGDTLPILGRNIAGDWLMIQLSDGRQGWVALQWVQASVPPTTLPIRETQVRNTPTPIRLTPAATASPTTAPIQALRSAPQLLEPHDGQTFGKRGPLQLTWSWDTALGADEYYVVTIAYPHQQNIWHDTHWVKERSFTPPAYLAELITGDRRCKWWVVVMRQTGKNTDGTPAGQAISQTSETRTFLWGD